MSDADNQYEGPAPDGTPPDQLEPPESNDSAGDALNWRLVIGALVTAGVIGMLVVDGLESETYFFTVDEAVAQADTIQNRTIRVKGDVVEGSIEGEEGEVGRAFAISNKNKQIRIEYNKALPDTFEEDVQVVATGKLDANNTLQASEIMVKCPSRYEGNPPTADEGDDPQAQR